MAFYLQATIGILKYAVYKTKIKIFCITSNKMYKQCLRKIISLNFKMLEPTYISRKLFQMSGEKMGRSVSGVRTTGHPH